MDTTYSANWLATTLNYEISAMWETKPRTSPQKDFSTFNGTGTSDMA